MLGWKLEVPAAQSEDEDARRAVPEEENLADVEGDGPRRKRDAAVRWWSI